MESAITCLVYALLLCAFKMYCLCLYLAVIGWTGCLVMLHTGRHRPRSWCGCRQALVWAHRGSFSLIATVSRYLGQLARASSQLPAPRSALSHHDCRPIALPYALLLARDLPVLIAPATTSNDTLLRGQLHLRVQPTP